MTKPTQLVALVVVAAIAYWAWNNHVERAVAHGGGGGHNDGMEARITKLEDFAQETRERLSRIETTLGNVEKEVSGFKWWVVAQIVAALLTVIGTGIAIQQMTVSTFQAAGQAHPAPAQQPPIIINVPSAAPAAPQAPASSE